jgi:two-component system, NtrC family, sensor kinase
LPIKKAAQFLEQMSKSISYISKYKYQFKLILLVCFFNCPSVYLVAQITDFDSWVQKNRITNELTLPRFQKPAIPFSIDEVVTQKKLQDGIKEKDFAKATSAAQALGVNLLFKYRTKEGYLFFQKATEYALQSKDDKWEIENLILRGIVYRILKKNDEALSFFKEAHQKIKAHPSPEKEAYILSQLATIYFELNDLKIAEEYLIRANKSYASQKNKVYTAISLNSLGELQLRNNDYNKALESFKSAIALVLPTHENTLKGILYRNIGLVYFKRGKFELALSEFSTSISFDNQRLVHQLKKDACMQLFTLCSYQSDFEKADIFHEKYIEIKESLTKTNPKKTDALENKWQNREKELVIDLLKKQHQQSASGDEGQQLELSQLITKTDVELNQKDEALEVKTAEVEQLTKEKAVQQLNMARQELQLSKEKNFKYLLMGLSIIAIVFLGFLYNRYQFKKNSNLQLQASNTELENTLKQLRETQDQLLQSEKMASLGLLTAGIAHEIQNPLNFVVNFSEGTLVVVDEFIEAKDEVERTVLAKELNESLKKIHHHGKRAERIVKSMLQHSREGSGEKEFVDLNQLVYESVNLAYHGVRANHKEFQCELAEQFDTNIPSIKVVPQDLSRVFLNIANNAFYALREKSVIQPAFKAELKITTSLMDRQVRISIKDNGTGIPKEKVDKIFQPFFTTKPSGQGTGLGLSMSYDIITKSHQGKIEIQSKENESTEFIIHLPLTT